MKFKVGDKVREAPNVACSPVRDNKLINSGIVSKVDHNNVYVDFLPNYSDWPYAEVELEMIYDPNDLLKEIL